MVRVALDARLLAYLAAGTSTYIRGILGGLRRVAPELELVVLTARKADGSPPGGQPVWTPAHHRWERWALGAELALRSRRAPALDVLHSPDFIPPARWGQRWARVITVHDLAFLRDPALLTAASRRYYGQIERAVAEAERVIAVSEATRRDLLDLVVPAARQSATAEKIVVIPEGVDPIFRPGDPSQAAERVAGQLDLRPPFFLFVGTLEPRKNLPRLLRAFATFRAQTGPAGPVLAIAGARGWLTDDLTELARPLGPAVRFLGRVSQEALADLYRCALALVLVSTYEGFGLPALEAMASGCPTLVADVAALPEVVGDAGLPVSPTDEAAIARGLSRLWSDPGLRRALAERGPVRAARFDWNTAARRTAEVYRAAMLTNRNGG
jgi:glycosyltransferase involved in cell wall biosynthesis